MDPATTATPPENTENPASPPAEAPKLPAGITTRNGQYYMQAKVDGEIREVPLSEAQIRLQKDVASDQRFQDAASLQKQLEKQEEANKEALEYWELSKKALYQNDEVAGRKALDLIGYEPQEPAPAPLQEGGTVDWSQAPAAIQEAGKFMEEMKALGIDPSRGMKTLKEAEALEVRNNVYRELGEAVVLDPTFKALLSKQDEKAKRIRSMLHNNIASKMREGRTRGAQTYAQVIREVKTELQDLGTLNSEGQIQPTPPLPGASFPGMGPANSGVGYASMIRPATRPKPISPSGTGTEAYGQNLLERWAFDLAESGG